MTQALQFKLQNIQGCSLIAFPGAGVDEEVGVEWEGLLKTNILKTWQFSALY